MIGILQECLLRHAVQIDLALGISGIAWVLTYGTTSTSAGPTFNGQSASTYLPACTRLEETQVREIATQILGHHMLGSESRIMG